MAVFDKTNYEIMTVSSLEKIFLDQKPKACDLSLSGFRGEVVSFQIAYWSDFPFREFANVLVDSPIKDHIRIRSVESVPVSRATMHIVDDNYLRTTPGLYPDLLRDLDGDKRVKIRSNGWSALWVDIMLDEKIPAGDYDITISLSLSGEDVGQAHASGDKGHIIGSQTVNVRVYDQVLPDTETLHTEWFYADCLADYYGVEVFSDDHWDIISNFMDSYVSLGCNMILTPLFTYPLDTQVVYERTTTQLVDVEVRNGDYHFSYDKLKRWIDLARSKGIKYFEMSHLFSQWGAKFAPKIIANVDGKEEKIFGWHTPSIGDYTDFLKAFIPDLREKLIDWGIIDRTYFHISDVPSVDNYQSFKDSFNSVKDLFDGLKTFEAISNYDFYKDGLVEIPVAASSVIHDFIDNDVDNLWTYYCVWQFEDVSNRYMAMPGSRTRMLGVQMYKYDIKGFLHWGYNFYNSALSYKAIDPYKVTDADDAFPAGDAFLVYPGDDKRPEESIRYKLIYDAFTDLRALKYLEKLSSRDYVLSLIKEGLKEDLTFYNYPTNNEYLLKLRGKINKEIDKREK